MSSHGDEMDRGFSTRSLSSRGESELTSRYMVDLGYYMSPFAATVFSCGLIIVGVLLMTLLIAFIAMFQTCQNRSSGFVELSGDDYTHCMIYSQHAELNNWKVDSFPSTCMGHIGRYMKDGRYASDLNFAIQIVEGYFNHVIPHDDGRDVVMMDIDDTILPDSNYPSLSHRSNKYHCNHIDEEAKMLRRSLTLGLYLKLQASGWPLILVSRKSDDQRNATVEYLTSAGYGSWFSLIMRLEPEAQMNNYEYFSKQRETLQEQGYRITGVISSKMDALTGPVFEEHIFKLPNPVYCHTEQHRISENTHVQL